MNLTTITYDADKWQLVPKELTNEMISAVGDAQACDKNELAGVYWELLNSAPQPETLSPWLPIDEFLNKPKNGECFIFYKSEVYRSFFDLPSATFTAIGYVQFEKEHITHVLHIDVPAPPKPEQGK